MAVARHAYTRYGAFMVLALVAPLLGPVAYASGPIPPVPDARFALALYCNPTCDDTTVDTLEAGLASIGARPQFPEVASRPMRIMGIAGPEFGVPDADYIADFGVGVDRPEALAGAQEVLLVWFAAPRAVGADTFAQAHAAFAQAAKLGGGWVEDLETQQVFGAEAWAARDPRGDVTDWFVVDAVPADDSGAGPYRLVTRGLRRFGDFELVVPDIDGEAAGDVGFVLNAVARELHGDAQVPPALTLDSDELRGAVTFLPIAAVDGDPAEPLLRVSFQGEIGPRSAPPAPAPMVEPEPLAAVAIPAGPAPAPAAPAPAAPPRSVDEASAQARERLFGAVRAAWIAGLPPGDKVAVSAPFRTARGGTEYLWVELRAWDDTRLVGELVNDPYDVAGLRRGDRVEIRPDDVFDYVWKRSDGTREGNSTAAFLKR